MSPSLSPICYYFAGKLLRAFRKDQQIWPGVCHAPCAPEKGQTGFEPWAVARLRRDGFGSALVLARQRAPPKTKPKSCSQLLCPGSQGTMLSSAVLLLIREQSRLLLAQITSKLLPAACWGGGSGGLGLCRLPGSLLCPSGTDGGCAGATQRDLRFLIAWHGCVGQPCPVLAGNAQQIRRKHQGRNLQTAVSLSLWERPIAFNRKQIPFWPLLSSFIGIATDPALQTSMEMSMATGLFGAAWNPATLLLSFSHLMSSLCFVSIKHYEIP